MRPSNATTAASVPVVFPVATAPREPDSLFLSYSRRWTTQRPRFYSTTPNLLKPPSSALPDDTDEGAPLERTVEEQYSRKTPLEHVLLRPGMYVGPVERLPPNTCWVLDPLPMPETSLDQPFRMVRKEYGLVPALIKIFDEILVNASDNRLRHPKSCTRIDVVIDPGSSQEGRAPFISVFNDGKGIPVQEHRNEGLYVPEMLFGHLLTGSNFDDNERRVTGGRHGYGAKLTNIFSRTFAVETLDSRKRKLYQQTWHDNMSISNEPEITTVDRGAKDYTRISFVPDMARLTGRPDAVAIDKEDYAVMCRRVVDVAGCAAGHLTVTLNGTDMSLSSFEEYSNMYRHSDSPPLIYQKINSRWEVGVCLSDSGSFDSVSFVNGMSTPRGGTHINAIVQQITNAVGSRVAKLYPELAETVTPGMIRRNLFVSCNALIENPTFDSQMKESLTSNPNSFGSSCDLPKKFLSEVVLEQEDGGPGIIEEVARVAKGRQQANLLKEVGGGKKSRRQLLSIPKLDDAHLAGSDQSSSCSLILTEGDSAKALAVAGLEVIGRERYGVFPLRGKFLNVRHASVDQLMNNAEVKALCSIIGLDFDKEYDTVAERSELRYGHCLLMTDQDADGSHIKGLIINFFRHFWPKLLKPALDQPLDKPFLSSFITPLLKAARKGRKETLSFYSMADYNSWRASLPSEDLKKWTVKYYKGLGTSTPAEAKEYFSAFADHHRPFHWNSELDGELLDMVFDKERAADRRKWILDEFDEEATLTPDPDRDNSVTFEDFVNNEMIHFSNADNIRSLPSLVDGLKPSQRKVLFACFKRKLKSEIKVAQLTGYCAEHTAYHHGEASLHSTSKLSLPYRKFESLCSSTRALVLDALVIGMAQDFVGSNNINLLVPSGQFGTRLTGGKDAASPRYIFTYLSPIARYLFPEVDDVLLTHREDDGQFIEPYYYCPIIPLILVNGSQGIGTGWSTFIPPHNPLDVLEYIRAKLDGSDDLPEIRPWVRGFSGSLKMQDKGAGYVSVGKVEPVSSKSVVISELPVGRWTNVYKAALLNMRDKGLIRSFLENHTTTEVSFNVQLKALQLDRMMKSGLQKAFKLETNLPTTNMNAFAADNSIQKFACASEIADKYFPIRLALYYDRKSVLESEMKYAASVLKNKARFIEAVSDGQIDLIGGKKSKEETVGTLRELGFSGVAELQEIRDSNVLAQRRRAEQEGDDDSQSQKDPNNSDFDYLLNMPLSSLTTDKINDLQSEARKTEADLSDIQNKTPEDLWRADLDKLEPHLMTKP